MKRGQGQASRLAASDGVDMMEGQEGATDARCAFRSPSSGLRQGLGPAGWRLSYPLENLDEGPRWVLCAAVQIPPHVQAMPTLQVMLACLLRHCGMDLQVQLVAAALRASPPWQSRRRSQESTQVLGLLRRRKRQPTKLRPP